MEIRALNLYWIVIIFALSFTACHKSRDARSSVDADVASGDADVDIGDADVDIGDADVASGDAGAGILVNSGDHDISNRDGSTNVSGNGGSSGKVPVVGAGGTDQDSGGSAGARVYDFEPRNEVSVSSIPRPNCPEMPPVEGAECFEPELECGYGIGTRVDCRDEYRCESGRWTMWWHSTNSFCGEPPENACPEVPVPGESCEIDYSWIDGGGEVANLAGVVCEYDGYVICSCSYEDNFFANPRKWNCFNPPSDKRCPPIMPNLGEGCDVQALECIYGDPCIFLLGGVFCRRGEWEENNPFFCFD